MCKGRLAAKPHPWSPPPKSPHGAGGFLAPKYQRVITGLVIGTSVVHACTRTTASAQQHTRAIVAAKHLKHFMASLSKQNYTQTVMINQNSQLQSLHHLFSGF